MSWQQKQTTMSTDSQVYKFNVAMTCGGCSKAVNSVLTKTEGVEKVDINMEKQLVTVTAKGTTQDNVLKAIMKTGKKTTVVTE